jgi:hypothetical protein
MISPSELDIQSTMENGGTCREREREKERGKKINKREEVWPVCCNLLYNKCVLDQ